MEKITKAKKAKDARHAQDIHNAKNVQNTSKVKKTKPVPKAKNPENAKKSKKLWRVLSSSIALVVLISVALVLLLNQGTPGIVFSKSDGIDENGFLEDVRALDYVENFDYMALPIPSDIHEISDSTLQTGINSMLASYSAESKQITDRAVADGDQVNIDYVGSVDGVEFDGGSTGGEGTDVTAGSKGYIDDFLTQIIGHMPGETINVEVTFPEDYGQDNLNGKNAVFVTTINYITEYDITDKFVEENLSADYGWTTIEQMQEGKRLELHQNAIKDYIYSYMQSKVSLSSIPDTVMAYQNNSLLSYYQETAAGNEMTLEEYLQSYESVSDGDELLAKYNDENVKNATYLLAVQAVAEGAGISVSDEDMDTYLPDYASYEEEYGLPYLKQYVLSLKVIDYVAENAVLE